MKNGGFPYGLSIFCPTSKNWGVEALEAQLSEAQRRAEEAEAEWNHGGSI